MGGGADEWEASDKWVTAWAGREWEGGAVTEIVAEEEVEEKAE